MKIDNSKRAFAPLPSEDTVNRIAAAVNKNLISKEN